MKAFPKAGSVEHQSWVVPLKRGLPGYRGRPVLQLHFILRGSQCTSEA